MGKIQLLDCTLRDGGYINDWKFGKKAIAGTIERLTSSGVDILEIGFLKDEPYLPARTVFNEVSQIAKLIQPKQKQIQYAAMIEVVNPLPLELLAPAGAEGPDIIRIIVWKERLKEGFDYCKGVVEKGYKICIQPARVDQYSYEEFTAMIRLFAPLHPMAIYVVDSFGTQDKDALVGYFCLADEQLPPEITLGYHGHNNLMQAFEVAQAFLEMNLDRDIIIDASVYGIGRGAGNLNSEIIANYLNVKKETTYAIPPMLEVYDLYLKEIFEKTPWGYSMPSYLTAIYQCNPNYATYYGQDWKLSAPEIDGVLRMLSERDRIVFTEDKADERWKRYCKMQLDMAVIIPTANRSAAIDYWLYMAAWTFRRYGIDIIVYDSSDDDKTEAIVRNFQLDGCDNVIYARWTGTYDGFSLDQKVIDACREYNEQYGYLWFMRDGLWINIPAAYEYLKKLTKANCEIIAIDTSIRNEWVHTVVEYKSPQEFFKENSARITVCGCLILSSDVIRVLLQNYPLNDSNYGLWLAVAPLHYMAKYKHRSALVIQDVFALNEAATLNSFWNKAGKAMEMWVYRWYTVVSALPAIYDNEKADALKIEMVDFHPFYLGSLLRFRGNGGLTFRIIKQYKQYLPYVCSTPLWKFYLIACIPKWLSRYIINHKNTAGMRVLMKAYQIFISDKRKEARDDV